MHAFYLRHYAVKDVPPARAIFPLGTAETGSGHASSDTTYYETCIVSTTRHFRLPLSRAHTSATRSR